MREYEKVARQYAHEGLDHVQLLARLLELELTAITPRQLGVTIRMVCGCAASEMLHESRPVLPVAGRLLEGRGEWLRAELTRI